jgi:hypothetical protein
MALITYCTRMQKADAERARLALKRAGIKGTVRRGTGSLSYTLRVLTQDQRVIQAMSEAGYTFHKDISFPERGQFYFIRPFTVSVRAS